MDEPIGQWNKTQLMRHRLADRFGKTADGKFYTFGEYIVLERDSPIDQTIDFGAITREAIIVDSNRDQCLMQVYNNFRSWLDDRIRAVGHEYKKYVLDGVFILSQTIIPYDETISLRCDKMLDEPMFLGEFIDFPGGVCRHQALLMAFILERLRHEGLIKGHVSVDRNKIEVLGGHAWVRYTNSRNVIYILDTALNYRGPLHSTNIPWLYKRPEDIVKNPT